METTQMNRVRVLVVCQCTDIITSLNTTRRSEGSKWWIAMAISKPLARGWEAHQELPNIARNDHENIISQVPLRAEVSQGAGGCTLRHIPRGTAHSLCPHRS